MSDAFFSALFAWILTIAGIASAAHLVRSHAKRLDDGERRWTPWMVVRDAATPFGMSLFGLRLLILGYDIAVSESLLCRTLLFLSITGIVGGIASWKISRLPID
jgi:hypothetical protein